jgi:hypothetical protein
MSGGGAGAGAGAVAGGGGLGGHERTSPTRRSFTKQEGLPAVGLSDDYFSPDSLQERLREYAAQGGLSADVFDKYAEQFRNRAANANASATAEAAHSALNDRRSLDSAPSDEAGGARRRQPRVPN